MSLTYEISTMMDLGLTNNQARIYLALIELGPSKAEEISKFSQITRQDVYRVIPSLQKMGFIESTLSRPMILKPVPLQETLSILVKRKEKETAELREHTKIMLKNHETKTSKKFDEDHHILFIPGQKALINKTLESMKKAKKSLHAVSSSRNVFQHRFTIKKDKELMKDINRNIEIRFVTDKPENPKQKVKSARDAFFTKLLNFKIRFHKETPKAHLLIIDKKEVYIRIFPKASFSESPVIWSNNPCIITIAQSYFEKMWNESANSDVNRKIQANEHRTTSH